jgi:hypothetical protein
MATKSPKSDLDDATVLITRALLTHDEMKIGKHKQA